MFTTTEDLLGFLSETSVEFVAIRFSDLPGGTHQLTIPAGEVTTDFFRSGVAFDGSSVRGFQRIHESDMTLIPDVTTSRIDPFRRRRTLMMNASVHDPVTLEAYSRDPRNVARKAEDYLRASQIADTVYFGAEAEFYLFDDVRFGSTMNSTFYRVESESGAWSTGENDPSGIHGHKIRATGGYLAVPPSDHDADLRDEMAATLGAAGFQVERAHHEVGSGGQSEINYRFNTLLAAADDLMLFKYIVKNTALTAGKSATFMPKPLYGENGSGLHCHQSLWSGGKPLFYDEDGYAGLSELARHYVGGILHHAPSLLAFTNPSVNSYRRLVPGYEAPVNLVYSSRNRSACIRIPITGTSPGAKRIEFRCPDPSGNPYLSFSAQLMAGLDGIRRQIEPPEPIDLDLFHLPAHLERDTAQVPASLEEVLAHLEEDHEYLLEGGVFTPDLIDTWIELKRVEEIDEMRRRPHPYEFQLYYDL